MDVLIWSLSLGNRFHVLNFMAWLLARINETLVWAHEHCTINLVGDKPVALSIVQARLVGLVHLR
jgi:hypothetical protein